MVPFRGQKHCVEHASLLSILLIYNFIRAETERQEEGENKKGRPRKKRRWRGRKGGSEGNTGGEGEKEEVKERQVEKEKRSISGNEDV